MDIYGEITNRIISEMEKGIIPWKKPWIASGAAISHTTGKRYSLLNQMLLGRPGEYITFKQAQQEGGHVRQGEKSHIVVFWKFLPVIDEDTQEEKQVPFLKYYNVFHIDQCEGITAKHTQPMPNSATADETAESIIAAYVERESVSLEHAEGDAAFYQPAADRIVLPLLAQFAETAAQIMDRILQIFESHLFWNMLDPADAFAHGIVQSRNVIQDIFIVGFYTISQESIMLDFFCLMIADKAAHNVDKPLGLTFSDEFCGVNTFCQ